MAEALVFPRQDISIDQYVTELGTYAAMFDPAPVAFAIGENYKILWDGEPWDCQVYDGSTVIPGAVYVGDASAFNLAGNGEPFVLVVTAENIMLAISLNDAEPSRHNLAIYRVTEGDPDIEGILLKDRKGNDVAYYGIETLTLDTTTEGKQQVYTKGVAVEGLEIVPDFSGGDMAVSAGDDILVKSAVIRKPDDLSPENVRRGRSVAGIAGDFIGDTEEVTADLAMADGDQVIVPSADGKVISRVTVKKPETLLPENIAKDVEIGGVVGTHEGGGEAVAVSGEYTPTTTGEITIQHNLGVMPDIIVVTSSPSSYPAIISVIGFCDKIAERIGFAQIAKNYVSAGVNEFTATFGIQAEDASGFGFIQNATPLSFTVGGPSIAHKTGVKCKWRVIGGLARHADYIAISLALDGMGGLIISGGVPEMTKLAVYSDGVYCGTVDYAHAEAVTVDISGIVDSRKKHTITVQLTDEILPEQYENIWIGEVYGWVSEPASGYALIDLDMARNGENMGTGGDTYAPTLVGNGKFTDGKFVASGNGGVTVPTPFMYGTNPWTVAFAVDKYTTSTAAYSRFARGDKDVPSLFYSYSAKANMFKLTSSTVFASQVAWYDPIDVKPWGDNSGNALSVNVPNAKRTIIALRNDGTYISMWINGVCKVKQAASGYTSTYWASTFGLGNPVLGNTYNMAFIEYSMFKLWDYALTDEKMALID